LLFVAIIILQSLLTSLFITRKMSRSQFVDARKELAREASSVYDNFNQWKLSLWKQINILNEDESIRKLAAGTPGLSFEEEFLSRIRKTAADSAVEFVLLKRSGTSYHAILSPVPVTGDFFDQDVFSNKKNNMLIVFAVLTFLFGLFFNEVLYFVFGVEFADAIKALLLVVSAAMISFLFYLIFPMECLKRSD